MKFAALGLVLATCQAFAANDPRYDKRNQRKSEDFTVPVAANEIKIMAYNVENLFDVEHDEGKKDWEFLPKDSTHKKNCESEGSYKKQCYATDWTASRLALKLKQIHNAIQAQGDLPDILVVEEIENSKVIGMLAKELGYSGYSVSDSPDERGVDVAILYNENKLNFLNSAEKEINEEGLKTRNILACNFALKGAASEILGVYANHWPSQGKKSEARMAAARTLKAFVEEQAEKRTTNKSKYHAILAGDFNTIDVDRPHPFHEVITHNSWKRRFYDSQLLFESIQTKERLRIPPGTYFFGGDGAWNRLDHMFLSGSLVDGEGLELVPDSFRVVAPEFMTRAFEYNSISHHQYASVIFGVPKAYEHNADTAETAGFSDHFPIVLKLKMN
jgi:endonuclease/exonuclease/phosphatase family metal-dependent hydrolase